jgi:hypothetical protein
LEASSFFFDIILHKLAESYGRSFTLEELTALVYPGYNIFKTFTENVSAQRENHAKILDALILMDFEGYVVINSATDQTAITVKGLIRINKRVLCN